MLEHLFGAERQVVVGIGEVLFDCFPGRVVLGGAPVNVAVHAHQLLAQSGGCGVVVSRVGDDELGRRVVKELASRGLVTDFVQVDSMLATGVVQVTINDVGEPAYEITEDVAWDDLRFDAQLELLAARCGAVCFGTLAQRCEPGRSTIRRFLGAADSAIRLFDVNLRQNYFTPEILQASFAAATVAKFNVDELSQICELLGGTIGKDANREKNVLRIQERFDVPCVAVTQGSQGTVLYCDGERYEGEPVAIELSDDADAVGAGDACSAGLLFGLLKNLPPEQIVELANRLGAFVASRPGATPHLSAELLEFASALPD